MTTLIHFNFQDKISCSEISGTYLSMGEIREIAHPNKQVYVKAAKENDCYKIYKAVNSEILVRAITQDSTLVWFALNTKVDSKIISGGSSQTKLIIHGYKILYADKTYFLADKIAF